MNKPSPQKSVTGILLLAFILVGSVFAEAPIIRALLAPHAETVLASPMSGRITAMRANNGQSFKQRRPLIKFDCAIQQAELRKAEADLQGAEAKLAANERMHQHRAVGRLEVETAQAEVQRAKAEISLRQAFTRKCVLYAPFNGRVVKRLVQPYQFVAEGTPLMEVLDDSRLKMELFVPSDWVRWLKKGVKFQVYIDETAKSYQAVVNQLGARVVSVSQTLPITAEIEGNPADLLAGMSGNARFDIPDSPSL
jgi:membrane fusion protein (multidrug efflux system)